MPTPPKSASDAAERRRQKQYCQRKEALEKQFDLGFITETQYLKKCRQALIRSIQWQIKNTELRLKETKRKVRVQKLFVTRNKQQYLTMLATSKLSDEKMGQIERYINDHEQVEKQLIELRNVYTSNIEQMHAMIAELKSMGT